MTTYKTYRKERYLFFWMSLVAYFLPYVVTTACLLPMMRAAQGVKWGIGLAVVALNAIPFLTGIFKGFRARFPFVNMLAFVFVLLAGFFCLDLFHNDVYTFLAIETVELAGRIAECVLWHFHRKYKRKAQTVGDVLKSGLLAKE